MNHELNYQPSRANMSVRFKQKDDGCVDMTTVFYKTWGACKHPTVAHPLDTQIIYNKDTSRTKRKDHFMSNEVTHDLFYFMDRN